MTQRLKVSGWEREIPDCWKIEFNNFPNKILRVDNILGFDKLFKAISNTGYTMTIDWVPPKDTHGNFVFRVVGGEGFDQREYKRDILNPHGVIANIESYGWALCSEKHEEFWLKGGEIKLPGKVYPIFISSSTPCYYLFENKYFSFKGEEGFIYDVSSKKKPLRKNLHGANIKRVVYDPFNRGFLIFLDLPKEFKGIRIYKNTDEQQNGFILDTTAKNSPTKNIPKYFSYLGLFDGNLNSIWWAEACIDSSGHNVGYFNLIKHGTDYMWFSAYDHKIKLDPKTGKIIEHYASKG